MNYLIRISFLFFSLFVSSLVLAQANFPNKAIRLVVPFPAGALPIILLALWRSS